MSVQETNELNYWKAYCQIIKDSIAPKLGPNAALFYCSETVRCIPAADWIPVEVTNLGVFFLADSLLDPTNLFYVPSLSNGYIKSLQTYLSYVDLGGSKDEGVIARYNMAQQNLKDASEGQEKALTKALAQYQQVKTAGLTTSDFPTWAASNAAAYNNAVSIYQGMAAQANRAAADYNGNLAPQYNQDQSLINSALYSLVTIDGVTMGVTNVDSNQLNNQLKQVLSGNTPTTIPATAVYQKGAYSIQGYAAALKNWLANYDSYLKNPQVKSVQLSDGKKLSLHDFGFKDTSASGSINYAPFISFGASFTDSDKRDNMKVEDENYNIDIKLTYGDMQAFTINPGKWDIGDPQKTYPNLRSGAPKEVKNLVRPVQILCGTAIGLEISFSGGAEKVFDSMYKHYQSINGGVRIFGFDIGLGGSKTSSDESVTHTGSWEGNSGKFVVKPVDGAGWCTLLGVLGERLH